MARKTLTAPRDLSWVTALERPVDAAERVEVDDDAADELIAQGWELAARSAGEKKAEKPPADPAGPDEPPAEPGERS